MATPTKSPTRPPTSTTQRPITKRADKTTTRPSPHGDEESLKPEERKPQLVKEEDSHQRTRISSRKRSRAKSTFLTSKVIGYEIDEMLPNMKLLLKKRKDWDFRDPDFIRAAYVESETGMMTQWKSENARIRSVKNADIQFKSNLNNDLKMRHLLRKIVKERREERKLQRILRNFENPPTFPPVQIYTNATTQMRHSFIRNNPTVPAFVVQHYSRFRKPPFKTVKKDHHKITRCG